jgi:hypothetical protein
MFKATGIAIGPDHTPPSVTVRRIPARVVHGMDSMYDPQQPSAEDGMIELERRCVREKWPVRLAHRV